MDGFDDSPETRPAVQAYLLGTTEFAAALTLQRRLVYEVSGGAVPAVILCEHPTGITIGREGSRAHVRLTTEQLAARQWAVRWVARGGGVTLHGPGQLACYPILPLGRMTPAKYLANLCEVVAGMVAECGAVSESDATAPAVFVRGRRIATFGVAVRNGVTSFGFVLNVAPDLELFRHVDCDGDAEPMTSLQRECPTGVRPTAVRQRLLDRLAAQYGFGRVSVFHTHPSDRPRPTRSPFAVRPR